MKKKHDFIQILFIVINRMNPKVIENIYITAHTMNQFSINILGLVESNLNQSHQENIRSTKYLLQQATTYNIRIQIATTYILWTEIFKTGRSMIILFWKIKSVTTKTHNDNSYRR